VNQTYCNHLEKTAGPIGESIFKMLSGAGSFAAKHPVGVVAGLGSLGALSLILDIGNKLRGSHQIVNEAGKRQVMNYQTSLLKQLIENTKQKESGQAQNRDVPIVPPLR